MRIAGVTVAVSLLAGGAHAGIEGIRLATQPPPSLIAGSELVPTPFDDRLFTDVTSISDAFGRPILFSHPFNVRQIGLGWATWSHGYTGNAYYTSGRLSIALVLPPGTKAVHLYAEPGGFQEYPMTAVATTGTATKTIVDQVHGRAGANGWAFYTTAGESIVSISISCPTDFSIGEIAVSSPCPADLDLDGLADFADFLIFLNYFETQDRHADFTADGLVDFSDYLLFLEYYSQPCDME